MASCSRRGAKPGGASRSRSLILASQRLPLRLGHQRRKNKPDTLKQGPFGVVVSSCKPEANHTQQSELYLGIGRERGSDHLQRGGGSFYRIFDDQRILRMMTRTRGNLGETQRLAVHQSVRPCGIETQHPIPIHLKPNTAHPGHIRARAAVINLRQRETAAALSRIRRRPRQSPQTRIFIIIPQSNRCAHDERPLPFAT